MTQIDLTFINAGDNSELDAEVSDDLTSEQVIRALIDEKFISSIDDPTRSYMLSIKGRSTIAEGQTLASAGVVSGSVIRVSVTQRGGGAAWIEILAIAASLSSIAQVVLMVADLWSRKIKEKEATKDKQSASTGLDEVKKIRIQMSDGTQVEFESWLTDPEKLKRFIQTFLSSSQSPKPLWVRFYLKNHTGATLYLSDTPESQRQLEELIQLLKLESKKKE